MDEETYVLCKKPSAWLPIALSLGMLVIILVHWAWFGSVRETDEGTAAHLFQIWLVLEALMVPFFAITWLPRRSEHALPIFALQIVLALIACLPVFYFQL